MNHLTIKTSSVHSNSILQFLIDIETNYDSLDRLSLETQCKNNTFDKKLRKLSELSLLLWDRDFKKLYIDSAEIFKTSDSLEIKAFVLQTTIAAAELQFNLDERKKWFRLWYSLEGLENSFYCQYLYLYQKANTFYYDGNRPEAIKIWSQSLELCRSHGYHRGQFRLLYFIGRAYHDLDFIGEAEFYYKESLVLAQKAHALRFIDRINLNLQSLKNKSNFFNYMQNEVLSLIEKGSIKKAKRLALYFCRVRRAEKRTWGAESEWILLCWILFAEQKMHRFFIIFDQIDDESIKQKILNSIFKINKDLFESSTRLKHVLSLISTFHQTTSSTPMTSTPEDTSIKHQSEVEKLIQLLKTSDTAGLSMEDICTRMWNLNYEPEIHAHRVYLLITKVRRYFGTSKSVINSYGGIYKLNPLLINKPLNRI